MAACGFGASSLRISNLDLDSLRPKLSTIQPLLSFRNKKNVQFEGLAVFSGRSTNAIIGCQSSASEADSQATAELVDDYEKTKSSDAVSTLIPNAFEVETLLTVLCDTTSIAEFELKLGGFRLYVTRNLVEQCTPPPPSQPSLPSPVVAHSVADTSNSNGSALALSKPLPSSSGIQIFLDKAADEGLVILQSPKVGYFRRSRTIKGKRAPPACKEKDTVKEGQVLCYIDQLGGEIPIESDISGEVVKILREDGDPVGYGDALIAILHSFPGIKKLQ